MKGFVHIFESPLKKASYLFNGDLMIPVPRGLLLNGVKMILANGKGFVK